ncbi:GDSL-type esterase/lipase family protein [Microvirga zambiensis]|uniref:GDSL-type esterase/lipase family protein n=1 Tax=Microvirga zambiensis TaxID=1402137 RepID=UPI00191CFAF2|nr:GDSL-type esterase/lipase family protein [Microvirga zambiensis]
MRKSLSVRSICIAAVSIVAFSLSSRAEEGGARGPACPQADLIVTTTPAPAQMAARVREHLALKANPPTSANVVMIGDSLVRGWDPAWARAAFAQARIWNLGIGGDKIQNVLWRLRDLALASLHPRRVVLLAGTNNIAGDNQPCAIAAGIAEIVRTLAEVWPGARIDVIAIPPRGDAFASRNAARLEANRLIRDVARRDGVRYLDADAALIEAGSLAYRPDKLHFTELAYRILGDLLKDPG